MNVVLVSDIHLGIVKNNDVFLESQLNFLKNTLPSYMKTNNIKDLFILGDLFDNRNYLNVMIKNEVIKIFEEDLKDFNIYILVGNHDSYYSNTIEVNSVKFLSKYDHIHVIEVQTVIELNNKKINLVPWIVDIEDFIENNKPADICFGHFNITGCKFNKSSVSESGMDRNIFFNYKKVFTGHFHTRSQYKSNNTEIIYLGAPFQFDRGDMDESRGFIDLNLDTLEFNYIDNTDMIEFVQVVVGEVIDPNKIKNNIVDVYIDASKKLNEKEIEQYLSEINNNSPRDIGNIVTFNIPEIKSTFKLDENKIKSIPDTITNYIDNITIDNKDRIKSHMSLLYNKAREDA